MIQSFYEWLEKPFQWLSFSLRHFWKYKDHYGKPITINSVVIYHRHDPAKINSHPDCKDCLMTTLQYNAWGYMRLVKDGYALFPDHIEVIK